VSVKGLSASRNLQGLQVGALRVAPFIAAHPEISSAVIKNTQSGWVSCAYRSQGDFSKAIEYHAQDLGIAKEVGDRVGEGRAHANIGTGHMYLNESPKPSPTSQCNMPWQYP
jgi:hypothetical protein